jgi:hypothetical protein
MNGLVFKHLHALRQEPGRSLSSDIGIQISEYESAPFDKLRAGFRLLTIPLAFRNILRTVPRGETREPLLLTSERFKVKWLDAPLMSLDTPAAIDTVLS